MFVVIHNDGSWSSRPMTWEDAWDDVSANGGSVHETTPFDPSSFYSQYDVGYRQPKAIRSWMVSYIKNLGHVDYPYSCEFDFDYNGPVHANITGYRCTGVVTVG